MLYFVEIYSPMKKVVQKALKSYFRTMKIFSILPYVLSCALFAILVSCDNTHNKGKSASMPDSVSNGQSNTNNETDSVEKLANYITTGKFKPDHILIVMEENHSFDQIIHSDAAPYIDSIAEEGALFTDAHALTHPSQGNYIALFSGAFQNVTGDDCLEGHAPIEAPNLGKNLIQAGYSFKGYAETMPYAGFGGCAYATESGYEYARKHCPWVNWVGAKSGKYTIDSSCSQPLTDFPTDFNLLPSLAFVIPNMGNNMHNIIDGDEATIHRGDDWLRNHLDGYVKWAKTHNSLLIITYDEDDFKPENSITTIFYGAHIKPGKYAKRVNHFSVLRTIEALYKLPAMGMEKDSSAIHYIWQ